MIDDDWWMMIFIWLVVEPYPSEKYEFVSWDDFPFPTEWKVLKFHGSKPPTRLILNTHNQWSQRWLKPLSFVPNCNSVVWFHPPQLSGSKLTLPNWMLQHETWPILDPQPRLTPFTHHSLATTRTVKEPLLYHQEVTSLTVALQEAVVALLVDRRHRVLEPATMFLALRCPIFPIFQFIYIYIFQSWIFLYYLNIPICLDHNILNIIFLHSKYLQHFNPFFCLVTWICYLGTHPVSWISHCPGLVESGVWPAATTNSWVTCCSSAAVPGQKPKKTNPNDFLSTISLQLTWPSWDTQTNRGQSVIIRNPCYCWLKLKFLSVSYNVNPWLINHKRLFNWGVPSMYHIATIWRVPE